MPILRLVQNLPLGPEEIRQITAAYEQVLSEIGRIDRSDPRAEVIAKKIIEIFQSGERDPTRMCRRALSELSPTNLGKRAS